MRKTIRVLGIAATAALCWHTAARASGQGEASTAARGMPPLAVSLVEGRLSVTASGHPIKMVAAAIAARTGVSVWIDDELEDERVTITLTNAELEDGLRRLFKAVDVFCYYRSSTTGEATLRAVWVYPKGRGEELAPVSPDRWASAKDLEDRLASPEPNVRANAIETLLERGGSKGVETALAALDDESEEVRLRVLDGLEEAGQAVPGAKLIALAISDPSPTVRLRAVQTAEGQPEARYIAESAQHDPDEHVRSEALRLLSRLRQRH